MKILIIGGYAPSILNFRGDLIRALRKNKWDVHVAAPGLLALSNALELLRELDVRTYDTPMSRIGLNPFSDLRTVFCVWRLIKKVKPDLVLTYTIKPNIWGSFASVLAGVPSISMVTGLGYAFTQGNAPPSFRLRITQAIVRRLYRAATKHNRRVIFQNPDDRDDFISAGCLANPSKAHLVNGSGVNVTHYAPAPLPEAPVFLMVARLLKNKGVREYCEAMSAVKTKHRAARFLLVGFFDEGLDGIDSASLERWQAAGLEYLGSTEDVRPALAQARIYVLPSYREGTPRSVLEAMATGRAILTSDAPGCRETVIDGENGFLVPVGDSYTLAKKMCWMIENPKSCARMGKASLRLVRQKYDVDIVNETLIRHLELDK